MRKTVKFVFALSCLGFLTTSCQKEEPEVTQETTQAVADPVLKWIHDMGFTREDFEDMGEHYLVGGDIIIYKDGRQLSGKGEINPGGRTDQWTRANRGIVGYVERAAISVKIDASATQWTNEIREAVGFWNNLDDSRINLYFTNGTHVDILVKGVAAPGGSSQAFGAAPLPLNGRPGTYVELNNAPNFIPAWRIRTTIAHEIGHAIGFVHTDEGTATTDVLVSGTPARDYNSFMNSGSAPNRNDPSLNNTQGWLGFSTYDYIASKTLYPEDYAGDRVYDNEFYSYNTDVVNAYGGDPVAIKNHWRTQGGPIEGRAGSPLFEVDFYRTSHVDLRSLTRAQAISHWLNTGGNEGRASSSIFDVRHYLANNPDIAANYGTAGYQKAYYHWLTTGIREGRSASPNFNVRAYLQKNPDVQAAYGTNYKAATYHWFYYGKREGRQGI